MIMFLKWNIICFVVTVHLVGGQIGQECIYGEGKGTCLIVIQCMVAVRSIIASGSAHLPRCGFEGLSEIVCCPHTGDNNGSRVADRECKNIAEQYGPPTGTKVINGKLATEGEFPHMAALAFSEETSTYHFRCGGSLISDRYILTAAHCVHNKDQLKPVFARVGVLDISDDRFNDSTDYAIDSIIEHPGYIRPKHYHDLAVIRLKKPVVMSDLVFPACLYTKIDDPTIPLEITGWGVNRVGRSGTSNELLKGTLTIVPNEICKKSYRLSWRLPESITKKQLCAQDLKRQTDTCQGDSGGPLQGLTEDDGYYRLVGVTSFGNSCATAIPGIYTKINKYLDWIESIVWPSN